MKLAYDLFLPGNGRTGKDLNPIIFLHGRSDSKKTWKRFAPVIADKTGREVYTLDARNHGDSPWSEEMNFEVLTNDLEEFMSDLSIPRAVLIGHSLGGRTALTLALRKPELVEKLIVEDMGMKNYSSIARRSVQQILHLFKASLSAITPGSDEDTAKKAIVEFIKSQLPPTRTQSKSSRLFDMDTLPIRREGDSYAWQANLDVLEDMLMTEKCDQTLSGVYEGDALFLYGTDSFFDVLGDEEIDKHFPRVSKVPVKDAGHLIHHDFPEEFTHHVLNFLCPSASKE